MVGTQCGDILLNKSGGLLNDFCCFTNEVIYLPREVGYLLYHPNWRSLHRVNSPDEK
jgi:hypothetical protein